MFDILAFTQCGIHRKNELLGGDTPPNSSFFRLYLWMRIYGQIQNYSGLGSFARDKARSK